MVVFLLKMLCSQSNFGPSSNDPRILLPINAKLACGLISECLYIIVTEFVNFGVMTKEFGHWNPKCVK